MTEDISDFENPDFEFRPDVEGARNDLELAKQKLAESSTDKNQQFWKAIITDYEGLIRQMQAGLRLEAARKLGPFNTWNPEAKAAFKGRPLKMSLRSLQNFRCLLAF